MSRRIEIEWPIEDAETGAETLYQVSAYLTPYSPGTRWDPPEGGNLEDLEIVAPGGYVVAESEWPAHGFTREVVFRVQDQLYEVAGDQAEAEYDREMDARYDRERDR